jgi:hypothetical protein
VKIPAITETVRDPRVFMYSMVGDELLDEFGPIVTRLSGR